MDEELFKIARQGNNESKLRRIINEKPHLLEGKTPRQNTVLHIASRMGHITFAEIISTQCPSLLVVQNCKGDTALHVAARAERSIMVNKLIECAEREHLKEEMMTVVNNEKNTALHEAARNNHDRVVRKLLNKQPELIYEINKDEASALYMAAEQGCLESVRCILEEAKKLRDELKRDACRGPENRTPLHAAVILRRSDVVEVLMSAREEFEFAKMKDAHGSYPLHYASAFGHKSKMAEKILEYDTSVAYLRNGGGQIPFHVAVGNSSIHVIKQFLQFCPDSYEAIDDRGWNALHFAVERGNVEIVKYILNSNELGELINEPNNDGNTPLHLAIIESKFSVFNLLIRDKRIDANVMNREGKTALDIAESDKELSNWKFRKILICRALYRVGGRGGFHRRDKENKKLPYDFYRDLVNILLVVAALIITVSFTAALTIPGGFNSKGKATLAREPITWLFIITDAISLFTAISATVLLFATASGDHGLLVGNIITSLNVLQISLGSLTLSFVFGLWLVLSKVVAIMFLIIFIVGFVPLFYSWVGPCSFMSPFTTGFALNRIERRALRRFYSLL